MRTLSPIAVALLVAPDLIQEPELVWLEQQRESTMSFGRGE